MRGNAVALAIGVGDAVFCPRRGRLIARTGLGLRLQTHFALAGAIGGVPGTGSEVVCLMRSIAKRDVTFFSGIAEIRRL